MAYRVLAMFAHAQGFIAKFAPLEALTVELDAPRFRASACSGGEVERDVIENI